MNPFLDRRVAFVGKLGGLTLREATALVRKLGGTFVSPDDERVDLLVLGAGELLEAVRATENPGPPTITETELWQQLGLLDDCQATRRLYTPAMLADLVGVPIAAIHRWQRSGLIRPLHTVHRLPYFAFEEIAVAKRLVELVENGANATDLQLRLQDLARYWPHVNRPLAELVVLVEGRRLLVKHGNAILEPSGQQRFDFSGLSAADVADEPTSIPLRPGQSSLQSQHELIAQAEALEDAGDIAGATDLYRAALMAGEPNAQLCFQLAECLYRQGELAAARERYSMAIELDDSFLEARANLGCVLAELGQRDLAIAAFEGALALHANYADAHYHLAGLLDAVGQPAEAQWHRERFHDLAPASPWISHSV